MNAKANNKFKILIHRRWELKLHYRRKNSSIWKNAFPFEYSLLEVRLHNKRKQFQEENQVQS